MQKVISFSGGQSSALMTILNYAHGDIVLFQDTGREHQKTYKFINDFEAHEKIPITRIKFSQTADPFRSLLEKKKYKIIPNRVRRICTVELKILTAKRYLRSQGIQKFINLIGFRADEKRRVLDYKNPAKKVQIQFPLYAAGINKAMVNEYWNNKPYKLEVPNILGNCTLCFMKGKNAIAAILSVYPELADVWIEDEKLVGKTYLQGISIEQIRNYAQNNLFKEYDLSLITPEMNCACTM